MRKMFTACVLFSCNAVLAGAPLSGAFAETSEAGNTYLAGGELKIMQPVSGDLIAAGGRISVERNVGADAAIAGGAIDIRAPIGQDLRIAGGTVGIEQDVGADLVAAGGTVRVAPATTIAGSAWIAGGEVIVDGKIGKGARIYGNRITLAGKITGDTRLYGEEIVLTKTARINGNLSYASRSTLPEEQRSQISGTVTRLDATEDWGGAEGRRSAWWWFHPLFLISMLVCGMLLYALFPNAVLGVQKAIREHPGRSLLIGVALLFSVPPVAILFMATVIGLPIGFALLLLYPLALLLGYLASAFFLGQRIAAGAKQAEPLSFPKQMLYLGLALLILSLALAVPFLGGFILLLAVVAGLGGWAVWWRMPSRTTGG